MRIYVAGAYGRRIEFQDYAKTLNALGHEVTSRWLHGEEGMARQDVAVMDADDVLRADCLVTFTHPKEKGPPSGGRHVEFGIAWQARKRLIVIGHRENVFHHLKEVEFYPTWPGALAALAQEKNGTS